MLALTQGLFSFSSCPDSEKTWSAQEAGKGRSQDSWPKMAKEIPCTMSCSACKLGGKMATVATAQEQSGHWSVGGEQWFVLHVTCFSWVLFPSSCYYPFPFSLHFIIILIFYFISIIKLFISQLMSFLMFTLLILSPTHQGGVNKQLSVVFSFWLGSKPKTVTFVIWVTTVIK